MVTTTLEVVRAVRRPVVLATTLALALAGLGSARGSQRPSSQLVVPGLPSVYFELVRAGQAPPLFEGESNERVWLQLHNNAKWAIGFCSFRSAGVYGDVGIVYS